MTRTIETADAPAAVGAYSQAKTDGNLLFTAGQIPLTSGGELLADAPISERTKQSLDNVRAVLASEGLSMSDMSKTSVFLADIAGLVRRAGECNSPTSTTSRR